MLNYQDRLQEIGNMALDVVERLLGDMETPIETQLNTAFKVIELCGADKASKEVAQAIADGIQKNTLLVENNAKELLYLESIVKKRQEWAQSSKTEKPTPASSDKSNDDDDWSIVREDQ
jgi:hypothetical protein